MFLLMFFIGYLYGPVVVYSAGNKIVEKKEV